MMCLPPQLGVSETEKGVSTMTDLSYHATYERAIRNDPLADPLARTYLTVEQRQDLNIIAGGYLLRAVPAAECETRWPVRLAVYRAIQ
jgi:hypothetical protein